MSGFSINEVQIVEMSTTTEIADPIENNIIT
jgi:hypothetical protein